MNTLMRVAGRRVALCVAVPLCAAPAAAGAVSFTPITPTMNDKVVTLTGRDLSIEQIVMVARGGAKVQLSPDAKRREADNYGLLLQAATEDVPVYWFNRGVGDQREIQMFRGDPLSPPNRTLLETTQLARFRAGAQFGTGPEVDAEDVVRAMMVVRANAMSYDAPSPQLAQMLIDMLNLRIAPVVQSRGTLGEGDLAQLGNVGATMVGAGEAYVAGVRMPADAALKRVGLAPLQPFAADDNALTSSNAYAAGQAALLVYDAEQALEWADLIYAIDLDGMNSSITPLSSVVQRDRPERWLNWHASRMLDMLRGSYLFDDDPQRIIQDPESLRASSIRQASAWESWSRLRDAVLLQANSSDHNPAVSAGAAPGDSWELATPHMMRFYVKGGPHSHGQHGYVVSNANWDPYPLANHIESFALALTNMDVAVMLRIERFRNIFFTGVAVHDVLPEVSEGFYEYSPVDLQQEIQSLANPVAAFGSAIVGTVEDLQAQTRLKVQHARQAVDATVELLAFDLIQGSLWLDVRKAQNGGRRFGVSPTAAWSAYRQVVPLIAPVALAISPSIPATTAAFLRQHAPAQFYGDLPAADLKFP